MSGMKTMESWHVLEVADAVGALATHVQTGLTTQEAERRLEESGPNDLVERGGKSTWKILADQLTGTMVLILMAAALASAVLGDFEDAVAIAAIVVLNAALGFSQEYRAEKAMSALKKLAVPVARVLRDGHIREISSRLIVPGDVCLLESGNFVPADARVIRSVNLRVQESALTGESEPVDKGTHSLRERELPLADRRNMIYRGTVVTYGRGEAVVTETGMNTEIGRIAAMVQAPGQESTPLQRRLDQLGRQLAGIALLIVGLVFALGLFRGEGLRLLFMTAVSLAVAAVPEGLPAIVTIALALGAQRMLKRRALIRKLPAVETLGSVTVICSDKTGTLTQNRMTVTALDVAGHRIDVGAPASPKIRREQDALFRKDHALSLLLAGTALCNDARLERVDGRLEAVGDPTESALLIAAAREGLKKEELEDLLPRVEEVPFDSNRKRMTTIHRVSSKEKERGVHEFLSNVSRDVGGSAHPYVVFTKGAVDSLLEISEFVWLDDHAEPMTDAWRERIAAANHRLAQSGTRVLGLAFGFAAQPFRDAARERALIFVGMAGMMDPPRTEAAASVEMCRNAGIRPIMITGDHPLTALHIAKNLGIGGEAPRVLTGLELDRMSSEELSRAVAEVSIYARVSPENKLQIVQALQKRGQIVAMTGDGVNDAPALKKADIGVAMGIAGTDVSKEAADVVLLDDNFSTIVAAVQEGRIIYDNIRKSVKYLLSTNSAEILVMLLGPLLGMPLPLLPLQILWINLVTDGLPALALSMEPAESRIMRRPPYRPEEHLFARGVGRYALWSGLLMTALALGAGATYWHAGRENWQTMLFTILALSQMASVLAIRSDRDSLFKIGLFSNPWLLGAVTATILLQLAVIYIPLFSGLFKTVPLSPADFFIAFFLSTFVFWAVELEKFFLSRRR